MVDKSAVPPDDLHNLTGLDERRLFASLSYLAFLVFIPLIVKHDDPFISFHAKQGLVVFIGLVIAVFIAAWLNALGSLLFAALLFVDVIALIKTLQGKRWRIPLLGKLSEKFSI